ncbi:MAG TPA: hypothetical protein VMG58_16995 [Candidatus Sulfotelmatobacter sp.]|nr:hypothetical protein [Candidatus Sulfotelmatobacter sp.]
MKRMAILVAAAALMAAALSGCVVVPVGGWGWYGPGYGGRAYYAYPAYPYYRHW